GGDQAHACSLQGPGTRNYRCIGRADSACLHHHERRRGYDPIGEAQAARHLRAGARRSVSRCADGCGSWISRGRRGGLERLAGASRRATANHQPPSRRGGADPCHARGERDNCAPGLESREQRQSGRIRALHQSPGGKVSRHHQGGGSRRHPVSGNGVSHPARACRLGLLTPSSNTTQEPELSAALPCGITLHTARVAYRDITPAEQMRCVLELEAESRKLADADVGAIVFAATAPTLAKGKGYDRELIKRMEDASGRPATTAATAFVEALTRLGVAKVAIGAPWSKTMDKPMVSFMQASGFEVVNSEVAG